MTSNARPALSEEQRDRAVELLRKYQGTREVARVVGCSPASITRIRQATEGVPPACYTPHHAIVSREQTARARLRQSVETGLVIAEEMLPYVRTPHAFREWAMAVSKLSKAAKNLSGSEESLLGVSAVEIRRRLLDRLVDPPPDSDPHIAYLESVPVDLEGDTAALQAGYTDDQPA